MEPPENGGEDRTAMALLQDEPKISTRTLLFIGIPSFLLAVVLSLLLHRQAHHIGGSAFCREPDTMIRPASLIIDTENPAEECGMSALTGQLTTLGLGILSFALFLRYPRNLFLMSMAFVNATTRLPETVTVFLQYLIHNESSLRVDEAASLGIFGLTDPTIPTVIMCFYSLLILFFAIIVVHDIRAVRYKWPIAFVLFAGLGYLESSILGFLGPVAGA